MRDMWVSEWLAEWRRPAVLLAVVGALARWLWAAWARYRWRRRHFAELLEAIAEECRLSADFRRWQYRYQRGGWESDNDLELFVSAKGREHLAVLRQRTSDVRKALWKARGYPDADEELSEDDRVRILAEARQTRRWRLKDDAVKRTKPDEPAPPGGQDMFAKGDTG